jgi:integrase
MKKRADGRYCKQILVGYTPDGKRKMKTIYGQTIKEVEKKAREVYGKIDSGLKFCDDMTVAEWSDIWLKTFKTNIANNTFARYQGIIENQIKPTIGNVPIISVRLNIIQGMINDLKEKYSSATIKKIKAVLYQIFKQAVKSQYIITNPVDGVDTPQLQQTDRTPISEEHIKKLVQFCNDGYKHNCFIMTLLYTGMRRGELLALTVNDIDIEKRLIYVNKAIEFIKNSPNIKTPKTKSGTRSIPIVDALLPYIIKAISDKGKDDFVFTDDKGNMYNKTGIQECIKDLLLNLMNI